MTVVQSRPAGEGTASAREGARFRSEGNEPLASAERAAEPGTLSKSTEARQVVAKDGWEAKNISLALPLDVI